MFFYELRNSKTEEYRAICGGSIITTKRVLTSSYCFYTNAKRKKRDFKKIRAVAAIVVTIIKPQNNTSQWRKISHVYLQLFYRYPAYSLALVEIDEPWDFNEYVSSIPYASIDQDFDGICSGIYVKAFESWSKNRKLHRVPLQMVQTYDCEHAFVMNTDLFQCSAFDQRYYTYAVLALGSGLICYTTGDPEEKDSGGILIGVTVQSNYGLPTFHHKVAMFHKWIKDGGYRVHSSIVVIISLWLSLYYSF